MILKILKYITDILLIKINIKNCIYIYIQICYLIFIIFINALIKNEIHKIVENHIPYDNKIKYKTANVDKGNYINLKNIKY